jgi:hypothetical protein
MAPNFSFPNSFYEIGIGPQMFFPYRPGINPIVPIHYVAFLEDPTYSQMARIGSALL